MTLVLPTQPTAASNKWVEQKFLMLGDGGIGKSEFWAQGKRTLFVETEPGLNHLDVMRLPARSWDEFLEIGGALLKAQPFPYDTLVIDTVDRWVMLIHEEVISRAKQKFRKAADEINSIGDIPNGTGWFWASQLVEQYLQKLENLPCAVALVGHVNDKLIEEPTRKYNKRTVSIGGQMGLKLLHWPDHTILVDSQMIGTELQRSLSTLPSQSREGKSRGAVVTHGMKWGKDAAANYAAFRKLFD